MEAILLAAAILLLVMVLAALWAILYQLVKQQGRFLLRLDQLEQRLAHAGQGASGFVSLDGIEAQPAGLPVGTPLPPFRLPDLAGEMVSLEEFRGKQVLLVHWGPQCGFCDLIAPDLAKLQPDFAKHNVQLLLVSYGEAETNREIAIKHGLDCPILLQGDTETVEAFQSFGTPVAYLVDTDGRVAAPVAVGANQVPELAREAVSGAPGRKRLPHERPLSESRIEREGLKAGTPAPGFTLPDIYGQTVSLEAYRGRRVLLVFSDPQCGPCDQLAPHLVRLQRQNGDGHLGVVMVGRGEAEENRRKAEEHGFEFPVALQRSWEISRAYGIFATPVAFLIGEDGVIARNVAVGVDEIVTLAREGLFAGKEQSNGRAI